LIASREPGSGDLKGAFSWLPLVRFLRAGVIFPLG